MANSLSPAEKSYILSGLRHPTPTRLDGRPLTSSSSSSASAFRSIQISRGDAPQANGSARVIINGGTEVVVGVKLEVVDGVVDEVKGKESWRASVEVDVTPSAYPQYQQSSSSSSITGSSSSGSSLSALSTYYTNIVNDHFIGYLPKLEIVDGYKYFQPSIHISISSTSTASTIPAIFIALRTAFYDLRVPRVKRVGWEGVAGGEGGRIGVDVGMGVGVSAGLSGGTSSGSAMKSAMTSGKGGKGSSKGRLARSGKERVGPGEDWELDNGFNVKSLKNGKSIEGGVLEDDGDEDGTRLSSVLRKGLPVCVTLNLIPEPTNSIYFLDATPAEEIACPSRLHVFFCSRPAEKDGKRERLLVCGTRIEGGQGVKIEMIPALLKDSEIIARQMMKDLNDAAERVVQVGDVRE